MNERITIIFDNQETGEVLDLEIPLNITANDLIIALNNAYKLNNGTGLVLKICETKNNVWKRYELSIQNNCK